MRTRIVLLMLAAMLTASCGKNDGANDSAKARTDSMKTANKAIMAAIEAGNAAELDKYVSENMKENTPSPGQKPGLAGLKEWAVANKAAFPDLKMTIEDERVDGDMLISRIRMKGTNTGPMMGMPASNKPVDVVFMDMIRWENGKFVEHWGYGEEMKMMTQLGMMPDMSGGDHHPEAAPAAEKK